MKPVEVEGATNFVFKLPSAAPGQGDLPCIRDLVGRKTTSFWKPSEEDNLDSADMICVQTYGFPETKIRAGFGDDTGFFKIAPVEGIPFDGERQGQMQYQITVNSGAREWLRGDGHFILEVGMCPPMPVSVWLDNSVVTEPV